jgi:hypothetical protein
MIDPSQPAFPEVHIHHFQNEDADGKHDNVLPRWMGGLTKREYIAVEMMKKALDEIFQRPNFDAGKFNPHHAAANAIALTNTLIAELSK